MPAAPAERLRAPRPARGCGRSCARWALAVSLLVATFLPPRPAAAQRDPLLILHVGPASGTVAATVGDLLGSRELRETLHSGLPVRIQVKVELWRDRFFDSHEGQGEWRASVRYEPLEERYLLSTGGSETVDLELESLTAVRTALQRTVRFLLRPDRNGRYYYTGVLEVETLSLSDLEELERWLRGDLAGAVSGEGDVEGAVGSGVRRLFVRLLGLPNVRVQARTETFRFGS